MIAMLLSNEADIAAASLSRTWERDTAVSFGITIMEGEYILVAPNRKSVYTNIWVYLDILRNTWSSFVLVVIIFATAFTIINASGTNNLHNSADAEIFNILNGMGIVFMFMRQQAYRICLRTTSSRILFFTTALMTYFMFAYYSADLTAVMTRGSQPPSIKSFGDVLKYGYDVITFEATSWHGLLKRALPGTAMSQVFKDKMDGNSNNIIAWVKADEAASILFNREKTLLFTSIYYALGSNRLQALPLQGQLIHSQQLINMTYYNNFNFLRYIKKLSVNILSNN